MVRSRTFLLHMLISAMLVTRIKSQFFSTRSTINPPNPSSTSEAQDPLSTKMAGFQSFLQQLSDLADDDVSQEISNQDHLTESDQIKAREVSDKSAIQMSSSRRHRRKGRGNLSLSGDGLPNRINDEARAKHTHYERHNMASYVDFVDDHVLTTRLRAQQMHGAAKDSDDSDANQNSEKSNKEPRYLQRQMKPFRGRKSIKFAESFIGENDHRHSNISSSLPLANAQVSVTATPSTEVAAGQDKEVNADSDLPLLGSRAGHAGIFTGRRPHSNSHAPTSAELNPFRHPHLTFSLGRIRPIDANQPDKNQTTERPTVSTTVKTPAKSRPTFKIKKPSLAPRRPSFELAPLKLEANLTNIARPQPASVMPVNSGRVPPVEIIPLTLTPGAISPVTAPPLASATNAVHSRPTEPVTPPKIKTSGQLHSWVEFSSGRPSAALTLVPGNVVTGDDDDFSTYKKPNFRTTTKSTFHHGSQGTTVSTKNKIKKQRMNGKKKTFRHPIQKQREPTINSWNDFDPVDQQQTAVLNTLLGEFTKMKSQMEQLENTNAVLNRQILKLQQDNNLLHAQLEVCNKNVKNIQGQMDILNDNMHNIQHQVNNARPTAATPNYNNLARIETRLAELENQFISNRRILIEEFMQFSCPSTNLLGSAVCTLEKQDRSTQRKLRELENRLTKISGTRQSDPIGPDAVDVLENGSSDAFCASARTFTRRNSKIMYETVMFQKGKMFSIDEGDFQVPKSGFYNFQVYFETDLCGSLSLCGPTSVSIRRNGVSMKEMARGIATDSRQDRDFVSASFLIDCARNDKIDLYLNNFSGDGMKNLMFCGYYVGT